MGGGGRGRVGGQRARVSVRTATRVEWKAEWRSADEGTPSLPYRLVARRTWTRSRGPVWSTVLKEPVVLWCCRSVRRRMRSCTVLEDVVVRWPISEEKSTLPFEVPTMATNRAMILSIVVPVCGIAFTCVGCRSRATWRISACKSVAQMSSKADQRDRRARKTTVPLPHYTSLRTDSFASTFHKNGFLLHWC